MITIIIMVIAVWWWCYPTPSVGGLKDSTNVSPLIVMVRLLLASGGSKWRDKFSEEPDALVAPNRWLGRLRHSSSSIWIQPVFIQKAF